MNRLLIFLWLVIISDGVGAIIGARAAWRMKAIDRSRPELAIAFAFAFVCYSIAAFGSTYNSIVNGPAVHYSNTFLIEAVGFRLLQTLGIWVLALTLMDDRPGFIRRALSRIILRFK